MWQKISGWVALLGSIITIITGITGVYFSTLNQADAEKSDLKDTLDYAIDSVKTCDLPDNEKSQLIGQLSVAMNTLMIKSDYKDAKKMFDNLSDKIMVCDCPNCLYEMGNNMIANIVGEKYDLRPIILVSVISLITSMIFGIIWAKSRKMTPSKE